MACTVAIPEKLQIRTREHDAESDRIIQSRIPDEAGAHSPWRKECAQKQRTVGTG